VKLYDISVRQLANLYGGVLDAGYHSVRWSGRATSGEPVANGVYFARLEVDGAVTGRTLILVD